MVNVLWTCCLSTFIHLLNIIVNCSLPQHNLSHLCPKSCWLAMHPLPSTEEASHLQPVLHSVGLVLQWVPRAHPDHLSVCMCTSRSFPQCWFCGSRCSTSCTSLLVSVGHPLGVIKHPTSCMLQWGHCTLLHHMDFAQRMKRSNYIKFQKLSINIYYVQTVKQP